MKQSSRAAKVKSALLYSTCSTTMLVTNKLAVEACNAPTLLTCVQLGTASSAVIFLLYFREYKHVGIKVMALYAVEATCFAFGLLANMLSLLYTSVGAVIAARSCVPLIVVCYEVISSSRRIPRAGACLALLGVAGCATGYASTDSEVQISGLRGGFWLAMYVAILSFQTVYGKWIISRARMSHLQRVLYTNIFGLPMLCCIVIVTGETHQLVVSRLALRTAALTCVLGLGISYSGWELRAIVDATTFSLIGVLNKSLSILLSLIVFGRSSSWSGIFLLLGSILSVFLYEAQNVSEGF